MIDDLHAAVIAACDTKIRRLRRFATPCLAVGWVSMIVAIVLMRFPLRDLPVLIALPLAGVGTAMHLAVGYLRRR